MSYAGFLESKAAVAPVRNLQAATAQAGLFKVA